MRRITLALLFALAAALAVGVPAAHAATQRAVISWEADADIDLHVYDDEGHHAFYAQQDAIPEATLSDDSLGSGSESFTDLRDPSTRPFGYEVCWFSGTSPVSIAMTWVD